MILLHKTTAFHRTFTTVLMLSLVQIFILPFPLLFVNISFVILGSILSKIFRLNVSLYTGIIQSSGVLNVTHCIQSLPHYNHDSVLVPRVINHVKVPRLKQNGGGKARCASFPQLAQKKLSSMAQSTINCFQF